MQTILTIVVGSILGYLLFKTFQGRRSPRKTRSKDTPEEVSQTSSLETNENGAEKKAGKQDLQAAAEIYQEERLHELPILPEKFLGRRQELADLKSRIGDPPIILGLHGREGVGKTALALYIIDKSLSAFQDAHLYIDLRGTRSNPMHPAEAMARVINVFRPTDKLPGDKGQLFNLYRSVMKGKRGILFLDNVTGTNQAKLLLPPKTWMLVCTSVKPLSLPGIVSKKIGPLEQLDAHDLITGLAPRAGFMVKELAKICRDLPLALTVCGKFLAINTFVDPAQFVDNLRDQRSKLIQTDDELEGGMQATFNMVYGQMNDSAKQILNKLLVFPGSFDTHAQSFVCEDENNELLGNLMLFGLVNYDPDSDRYYLHDQIRKYLRKHILDSQRSMAERRHSAFYLTIVVSTCESLERGGEEAGLGLKKFDLEWDNIRAGQAWARSNSNQDDEATRLCSAYTESGAQMLKLRQPPEECIRWFEAALGASKRLGDVEAEKAHLLELGTLYCNQEKYESALDFLEQAGSLSRQLKDSDGEKQAVGMLGIACMAVGRSQEAIGHLQTSLRHKKEFGDSTDEEILLENLGSAYEQNGDLDTGLKYLKQGLEAAKANGNRECQARILKNLGTIYSGRNDNRIALEFFDEALALAQETKNRAEELKISDRFGDLLIHSGESEQALDLFNKAVNIAKKTGDRGQEAFFLKRLGDTYVHTRNFERAVQHFKNSAAAYKKIKDPKMEGESRWSLSRTLEQMGLTDLALQQAKVVITLFEDENHPDMEEVRQRIEEWESRDGAPETDKKKG